MLSFSRSFCTVQSFLLEGVFTLGDARSFCWADVKNSTIGFNVVFDADVKKQPRVTHCENR